MMSVLTVVEAVSPNRTLQAVGCGILIVTVLLVWGLVNCGKRLKNPDINRKCLISYMCFTMGWVFYFAIAGISMQSARPMPGVFLALSIFAGFGIAGVTLAIMGLAELKRSASVLKEGSGTAMLTLVLSGLVVVGIGTAFGLGVVQGLRGNMKTIGAPGAPAVLEDLGFSIQPPAPWARVDPANVNPLAAAVFARSRPEGYLMVLAERVPSGSEVDFESLSRHARDNLGRASTEVKVLYEADKSICGRMGRRITCEATVQGTRLTYFFWLHAANEVVYQLIAWAETGDASAILPEARKAFDSFKLLQPK